MNKRQKARKRSRAQAHHGAVAVKKVAVFVPAVVDHDYKHVSPKWSSNPVANLDVVGEQEHVKVDMLATGIMIALKNAKDNAKRQRKTSVLIREMAKFGYRPKEGVEPKPSTTTTSDWEPDV